MTSLMNFSDTFLRSIPDGHSLEDVRILSASGTLAAVDCTTADEELLLAEYNQARPDPINAEGKPTIMRITAWMAHEGVNGNRQGFIKEELQLVAESLFKSPNFGVMDFNHSAVRPFTDDPKVVGVWYKAEFAFDSKAKKWGILATGMLWSWLFPEHADILLAEQARKGKISFSMACLASSIEYVEGVEILHNPIFFTVSALDVPPADKDALGVGSEDVEDNEESIRSKLLAAALEVPWKAATQTQITKPIQGGSMSDTSEVLERLTEERVKAESALAAMTQTYTSEKQALETTIAELTAKVAELETKVEELETVKAALVQDKEDAVNVIKELDSKVSELMAIKEQVEAEKLQKANEAILASRIAQLPESIRTIHASKSEATRKRVEDKWLAMSDEEWTTYLEEELLGYHPDTHVSFFSRSQRVGNLPNIPTDSDTSDIETSVKKLLR